MTLQTPPSHINSSSRMRTGKELILSSQVFAVENRMLSWYYTLSTLCLMTLAFVGTFLPIHWAFRLVLSIVAGLLMVRMFVIYHDYQHRSILQKSAIAKSLMTVFGIFVLAPANIWRRTHDHHHHHNSKLSNHGIGSFPLLSKKAYQELSPKQRFQYLATRHPVTIFGGYLTLFMLDFNVLSVIKSPKSHWDSLVALVVHFLYLAFAFYTGGLLGMVLSVFIPFFIAQGLGAYLFYAQHNFEAASFVENPNWDYTNAALNSTSFMVMGPIMNWFTAYIGYHHVHHVNHRIPFYRLKEAMYGMPELQSPLTTSLHPRDVWGCLRLKVWDGEKGKMTPLPSKV